MYRSSALKIKTISFARQLVVMLTLLLLGAACTEDTTATAEVNPYDSPDSYFSQDMELVNVEVYYEPSAAPFTGTIPGSEESLWSLASDSISALFEGREADIIVPETEAEMNLIDAQNSDGFTIDDLLELEDEYRIEDSSKTEAHMFVVFLDGYYQENGELQTGVIGVNLSNTSIVAIFKPVIESTQIGSFTIIPKFVEQSTIVHELGHALGLVNNGLPLTSDHHDSENGAHCTDEDCVMYWLNEGAADLRDFVQQIQDEGETVMFATDCLTDATSFQP